MLTTYNEINIPENNRIAKTITDNKMAVIANRNLNNSKSFEIQNLTPGNSIVLLINERDFHSKFNSISEVSKNKKLLSLHLN